MMSSGTDEMGVSEVVGYIIILGIVLGSVGIVFTNALPVLENTQEREHISNTERTFNTLQANINEIVEREVPQRATEMRLWDSTVMVDQDFSWINSTDETSPGSGDWRNRSHNPIVYEMGEEKIVYENGAIIRVSGDEMAMLSEPRWRFDDGRDAAVLPVVRTSGQSRVSGGGTVLVRAEVRNSRTPFGPETDFTRFTINSSYDEAWERYFERLDEEHDIVTADGTQIEVDADRIIYSETLLTNRLSS